MTVSESIGEGLLRSPAPGSYKIQYTDNTHCAEGEWIDLFLVSPEFNDAPLPGSEAAQAFFALRLIEPPDDPETVGVKAKSQQQKPKVMADWQITSDALTQCLVRTNILRPEMTTETMADIYRLSESRAVVLIPDTNALSTGTLHWLLDALTGTQVWILPVVVSLITVQTRDAMLKSCVGKREHKNLGKALRSRQLINASLSLLERHRERYQVLEVDPQLLRYVRPAGGGSADPDEGDVLEDRLLLEAIHSALRATRSRAEKRVVTSDMLLARMLRAEGLPALFLKKPALPAGDIPCLRYEPLAKAFVGASLTHLMWELAHTFSVVRLIRNNKPLASFDAYWSEKTADDWAAERVLINWEPEAVSAQVQPKPPKDPEVELSRDPETTRRKMKTSKALSQHDRPPGEAARFMEIPKALSRSVIPEVAFPQTIRLAAVLLEGPKSIEQLRKSITPETARPSLKIARNAAEVLIRGKFALVDDDEVLSPTDRLKTMTKHLAAGKLDAASSLWEEYRVYSVILHLLKEKGNIKPSGVAEELAERLNNKTASDRSERVWRLPIFLGQAWSQDDEVFDGSARPDTQAIAQSFMQAFAENAKDGLASLSDLLPNLCRSMRCAPWFCKHALQTLVNEDRLSEFSFQPSAGKKVVSSDQIVSIQDGDVKLISSPTDRLEIGGRPVFTVIRAVSV